MDSIIKIIDKYLKMTLNIPYEVTLKFTEDKGNYTNGIITFMVDLAKIDKNSSEYDENYSNFFRKPKNLKGLGVLTYAWSNKIQNALEEFRKITGQNSRGRYHIDTEFYNYDYLTLIDEKVVDAISKTDYPNIKIEWEKDDANPHIRVVFSNFTKDEFLKSNEFITQLQSVLGNDVDLSEYRISYRQNRNS